MSKVIDNLIEKRVKEILSRDNLTEDDLKFLLIYRSMQKVSPLEKLMNDAKKLIGFLNTPDDEGDE